MVQCFEMVWRAHHWAVERVCTVHQFGVGPLGSREGLHGPPIWSGVGQGFGWSRQKQLVLVWSCRSHRATHL